jgi:Ser/Thr protein kinase RdoA (MazF antagonist)
MVKPAISRPKIRPAALSYLLSQYGLPPSASRSVTALAGGFSGTNYRVEVVGRPTLCVKICHGYSRAFCESQAKVQDHLRSAGFALACFALPILADGSKFQFATLDPDTGDPCLALTFLEGRAADAVLESGAVREDVLFMEFGRALAKMHSVKLGDAELRHFSKGGACDVQKHIDGTLYDRMKASTHTRKHPFFTDFYGDRLAALRNAMARSNELPQGVLHGDPFLDNALVDPSNGSFSGFVDFEDATTGPLLFDVACCVIGTCFPEGSSAFDVTRFGHLMRGYCSVRRLSQLEVTLFASFARLTLLCNCSWRFINFFVDHREVVDCRDRYLELHDRILTLERRSTVSAIQGILRVFVEEEEEEEEEDPSLRTSRRTLLLAIVGFFAAAAAVADTVTDN